MSTESFRKLRARFTIIAMASVAVVMFAIMLIINVSNYNGIRIQIKAVLDYLCANNGVMPSGIDPSDLENAESIFNEEFRYTTRYFTVVFNGRGEPAGVNTTHIAAVDKQKAISYGAVAMNAKPPFGRIAVYYYEKHPLPDGSMMLVFLDSTTQLRSLRRLIKASIMIFVGALFIVFWPVWIQAGKLIKPELENIARQKQFITNASHELKTPLAVIRANTELEEIMNGTNEWNQSTLKQVERLEGLITDLMTLVRASEGSKERIVRETDISELIRETAGEFAPVAEKQGKTLTMRLSSPYRFKADTDRLRQLVRILVDNAIKYCDDGGRITVELKKKGRSAQLSVSNDYAEGEGQDYTHFFDRFYRQDSSHNTEKGGYGIGLAIARDLVAASRGRIDVNWKNGVITFVCLLVS